MKPPGNENSASLGGQNALRVKVAEIVVSLMLERERLTPWQREDHDFLLGGYPAHGLWIYKRPDSTLYGCNYDSLEKLQQGTIDEQAKRKDYPKDLNACAELIDFLADKGWHCRLGNGLDKTWECEFYKDATENTRPEDIGSVCGVPFDQEIHYASADTLTEAICHAFIAVMEGKEK